MQVGSNITVDCGYQNFWEIQDFSEIRTCTFNPLLKNIIPYSPQSVGQTDCGAFAFGNLAAELLDRCPRQILGVFFQQAFLARIVTGMPLPSMKKIYRSCVAHVIDDFSLQPTIASTPNWAW